MTHDQTLKHNGDIVIDLTGNKLFTIDDYDVTRFNQLASENLSKFINMRENDKSLFSSYANSIFFAVKNNPTSVTYKINATVIVLTLDMKTPEFLKRRKAIGVLLHSLTCHHVYTNIFNYMLLNYIVNVCGGPITAREVIRILKSETPRRFARLAFTFIDAAYPYTQEVLGIELAREISDLYNAIVFARELQS